MPKFSKYSSSIIHVCHPGTRNCERVSMLCQRLDWLMLCDQVHRRYSVPISVGGKIISIQHEVVEDDFFLELLLNENEACKYCARDNLEI